MTPIREAIGGQNQTILNLLHQFVSNSFRIESFNMYTMTFCGYDEQLSEKLDHFIH